MNSLERSSESTRASKPESQVARSSDLWSVTPLVDVYENDDELLVVADVPGARADSVEVRLEPPRLVVTASQTGDATQAVAAESVRFERTFRVPDGLDSDQMQASVERGVLSIHLRKSERIKPKRIAVRGD